MNICLNVNKLFITLNKISWLKLKRKNGLRMNSKILITINFLILTHKDDFNKIPFVYTFDIKRKDALSKSNLEKLFHKHYLPFVNFCLEKGYSINKNTLLYVTEISTIIQT